MTELKSPFTIIFVGRSGAGKGTQIERLKSILLGEGYKESDLLLWETGNMFRQFLQGEPSLLRDLAEKQSNAGLRQPSFLACMMWSNFLAKHLVDLKQNLIIDGTPRSLLEAEVLDTAINFLGRPKPLVINLHVGDTEAKKRLLGRGRHDDTEDNISGRLAWYERDVVPVIEFYRGRMDYRLVEINGEQPVEQVTNDIVTALKQ